jgi:hypothetical protein
MLKSQNTLIFVLAGLLTGRIARNTVLKQKIEDAQENKLNVNYLLYLAVTAFGSWYSWKDSSVKNFFVGAFGGAFLDYVADRIALQSQTRGVEPTGLQALLINETPNMYVNSNMYVNDMLYINCVKEAEQTEVATQAIYDNVCTSKENLKISLL